MTASMPSAMKFNARRSLTPRERAELSPGLVQALERAGAQPAIVARPSLPAIIVRLWRREVPVMVLGQTIYWPGANTDFSGSPLMRILQHELQHVLEFATGDLTRLGYVISARNWTYRYRLSDASRWSDFGAEQRASLAEHYWLAEQGLGPAGLDAARLAALIPWARDDEATR